MVIKLHHPFKVNEFKDWFFINIGIRCERELWGGFIVIFNFGIEVYFHGKRSR